MPYKVVTFENKIEKSFASLKGKYSDEVWTRMLNFLKNIPEQGKKEMQFRKYDLPDANRILYDVLKAGNNKIVRIVAAGNHDHYEKILKKYGKKK
ncbi:MAG: hypothetical protein ACR2LN_03295 [Candidatus Levyibacteriota bacterium]